jgi:hypothetical protein
VNAPTLLNPTAKQISATERSVLRSSSAARAQEVAGRVNGCHRLQYHRAYCGDAQLRTSPAQAGLVH